LENDNSVKGSPPLIAEGLFSFEIGGSERVGADLAVEFKMRGYRVLCFALYGSKGPIRDELQSKGIDCVDLNYTKHVRFVRRLIYPSIFSRFLVDNDVHTLHVHHATALVLCGPAARKARTSHVSMTEHALHQLKERSNYRRSAAKYCRYADSITGVHPGITDYFREQMHVPRDRLHVISNGVHIATCDEAARQRLRQEFDCSGGDFIYLFAGRLQPVKDVGTLLRAFASLPIPSERRIKLWIAGDGPERPMLTELSGKLGLHAQVRFLGARTDVPALMSAADGFVLTSITEGLPMALIEAMGHGLPCIATAVGGIPELLGDGVGIIVEPRDHLAVGAALQRLTADSGECERFRAAGLTKVARLYDLKCIVDQYLDLFGLPPRWPDSSALCRL
jgi:glycosyltransferase involved in cell wall biosynthesis